MAAPQSDPATPDANSTRRRWIALGAGVVLLAVVLALAVLRSGGGERLQPEAYQGLGAWVDVFDYVPALGAAPVGEQDIDAMAAQGVRTIYLQAAFDSDELPGGVVPEDAAGPLLRRAHDRGMRVVGWYAPRLRNPEADLDRLLSIAGDEFDGQRFDGVAVDIEDRSVEDVADRNRRLVDLSRQLRERLGDDAAIGAIVLPTVLLERVNTRFWPDFPWAEIAPFYDVWMPMTYWTDRLSSSGYRDPARYVEESVSRTRELIGRADAPVHPIGGIGDMLGEDEVAVYAGALAEVGAIGGSVYDYRTMPGGSWGVLRGAVPEGG